MYSLIVEEGTVIDNLLKQGKINLPDEELERNMYWYVKDYLELKNIINMKYQIFLKKGMNLNTI